MNPVKDSRRGPRVSQYYSSKNKNQTVSEFRGSLTRRGLIKKFQIYALPTTTFVASWFHSSKGPLWMKALAIGSFAVSLLGASAPEDFQIHPGNFLGFPKESEVPKELTNVVLSRLEQSQRFSCWETDVMVWYSRYRLRLYSRTDNPDVPAALHLFRPDDPLQTASIRVAGALSSFLWRDDPEQGLDVDNSAGRGESYGTHLSMSPLKPAGPYIRKDAPEDLAARLSLYGDRPKTVLLQGPSGVGKTTLARKTCALLGKERVLLISSAVLMRLTSGALNNLLRQCAPDAIILDDVDTSKKAEDLLDVLGNLRTPGVITFITRMCPNSKKEDARFYIPGMRPGRIDEFLELDPPDPEENLTILRTLCQVYHLDLEWPLLVRLRDETTGFPGAYLEALVERIAVQGVSSWERELQAVKQMAPPSNLLYTPPEESPSTSPPSPHTLPEELAKWLTTD